MRKIIFRGYAKTVGTDFAEAELYPEGTPDSVLDEGCFQAAIANAEMYGYDYSGGDEIWGSGDEEEETDYEHYITDSELGYYWEEYNGEEHDGLRIGGGSFEEDFAQQAKRMG